MIITEFEQGTPEWMTERVGVPTASNFDKIFTSKGAKSAQSKTYMNTLLGEWATDEKVSVKQTEWMERGIEMEEEARTAYEYITGHTVTEVGLCFQNKDRLIGASPDGLIRYDEMEEGKDFEFGLEIKCPAPGTHISYLLGNKVPTTYVQQVQGSMWVTGLEQWDFMSYFPGIKPLIITVDRDPKLMTAIDEIMAEFIDEMLSKRKQLTDLLAA